LAKRQPAISKPRPLIKAAFFQIALRSNMPQQPSCDPAGKGSAMHSNTADSITHQQEITQKNKVINQQPGTTKERISFF